MKDTCPSSCHLEDVTKSFCHSTPSLKWVLLVSMLFNCFAATAYCGPASRMRLKESEREALSKHIDKAKVIKTIHARGPSSENIKYSLLSLTLRKNGASPDYTLIVQSAKGATSVIWATRECPADVLSFIPERTSHTIVYAKEQDSILLFTNRVLFTDYGNPDRQFSSVEALSLPVKKRSVSGRTEREVSIYSQIHTSWTNIRTLVGEDCLFVQQHGDKSHSLIVKEPSKPAKELLGRVKKKKGSIYTSAIVKYLPSPRIFVQCSDGLQLLYPHCPQELAAESTVLPVVPARSPKTFPKRLRIDGTEYPLDSKSIFSHLYRLAYNPFVKEADVRYTSQCLYRYVLFCIEKEFFADIALQELDAPLISKKITEFCERNKVKLSALFVVGLEDKELLKTIIEDKGVQKYFSINEWVRKNHRPGSECTVSQAEIEKFYQDYKWAFRKALRKDATCYPLDEVRKKIIAGEIKRLKYYRLDKLLTHPPTVEILWEAVKAPAGPPAKAAPEPYTLDELKKLGGFTEEEWRAFYGALQQKAAKSGDAEEYIREFLESTARRFTREQMKQKLCKARQGLICRDVFTKAELEALFREPGDYSVIKDSYERFAAYNWHGRFEQAQKLLVQEASRKNPAPGILYALGRFHAVGRPGIPARPKEAWPLLKRALAALEAVKKPTTAQRCLTIKLYRALIASPEGNKDMVDEQRGYTCKMREFWEYKVTQAFQDLAKTKDPEALYVRAREDLSLAGRSSGGDRTTFTSLQTAAAAGHPDALAYVGFIKVWQHSSPGQTAAARAGVRQIKKAVRQHSLEGLVAMGRLYADGFPIVGGKNDQKATYWLTLAADRGHAGAKALLKQLSEERPAE